MTTPIAPDPAHVAANARGLKVHLRVVPIGATTYRVVTLRPATTLRFSTNRFHDTWHLLSSPAGALVLGRLVWGLAFQRQPGTLVLIDAPHLVPTPFEADPPDPIALIPAGLTPFAPDDLRVMRRRLRTAGPPTTIRWHTFGLPLASTPRPAPWRRRDQAVHRHRERMSRCGGMLCYSAPPDILRAQARSIYGMSDCIGSTYLSLAESDGPCRADGEVQIFRSFDRNVAAARVARREALGDDTDGRLATDDERTAVWRRQPAVAARMRAARR